jgi:hypothetical protein
LLKRQLRIALQNESVTIRTLRTLIVEIQSILNDRPLAAITADADSILPITPNMLVHGRNLSHFCLTTDPKPFQMIAFQDMWLKRKQVLNSFWSRWTKDYLEQLSVSPKWTKSNKNNLNVGDVVLLKNETLTKNVWQLARIKQLLRNKDDLATKVLVQMPQGHVLERTMRQVALLESHQDLPMKVDSPEERNQLLGGPMIAVGSERRGGQPNFHRPRVKDQPPERLPTVDSTNVNVDAPEIVAETNSCSPVDASVAPREIKKKRKRHPRGHYDKLLKGNYSS